MRQEMHTTKTNYNEVRLVPVIEMEPSDYARNHHSSPSHLASSEEWDQYWYDCLADSGITGVQPIRTRSWCVPLKQLTQRHTLEQLLQVHCSRNGSEAADVGTENTSYEIDPDNLLAFSGGYALCVGDQVMITPRCCADLADIDEWRTAAAHRGAEKVEIWIGHPSIAVQFDGTRLLFSEEPGQEETEWSGECLIEPHKLQAALHQAEQELLDFAGLLLPVVEKATASEWAIELTETLTGTASMLNVE